MYYKDYKETNSIFIKTPFLLHSYSLKLWLISSPEYYTQIQTHGVQIKTSTHHNTIQRTKYSISIF